MANPEISALSPRTSPVIGEAVRPTNWPISTSRAGRRAIDSICSTVSVSPPSWPPLNSSTPFWRRKVAIALAATATSPVTNVSAVGPSSSARIDSAPAFSAARSVSVFFVTWNWASASRSDERRSTACFTESPR